MRDLCFRAWDEDAEDFAYSSQHNEDEYCWGFEDGKIKAWALITKTPSDPLEPPYPDSVEIGNPEQYTGLKDNKRTEKYPEGQKIYEGDKVQVGKLYVVVIDDIRNLSKIRECIERGIWIEVIGHTHTKNQQNNNILYLTRQGKYGNMGIW